MTLRDGKIVYELNGLSRPDWTTLPKNYRSTGSPRWDGTRSSNGGLTREGRFLEVARTPQPPADAPPPASRAEVKP